MKTFEEFLEEARELRKISTPKKSGTMPIPGSEGKARKDVAVAGFRRKGPIQEPKVEKSGKDVPVWVRSHKSPAEYAAHTSRKNYKEGERTDVKSLRKQLRKTGAKKNTEVHDITVGSPKSKVKEPGQRARQFVGALKDVASKMKEKKGIATNTPTAISSSGKKRKRSDEEGAEQRGRIYKKLGMGERDTKTGVQMAKLKDSFDGKTFGVFILEAQSREDAEKKKGRSGPKYNYEVALVNLYNHLTKSGDKANNKGKILRGLVSRGDTEELTDFLAQELNAVKNDEKHPLHFSNIGDEGFSGGKKTEDHRDSYYGELEDQFYTFLNDSQSKLGKRLISQGYTVKRLGDDKIPLSKSGKTAYGKESDTSKADIVFQHPTRPERENYTSLKKASGAVSASAGADETAGNYTVGMRNALKLALKSGRITKDQSKQLESEGNDRISALKDAMSSSKGMSKEQQKDLLPQLDKLRGSVEELIPGTERETAKAQLSGEGKYEKPVDSFVSTGKGGGRKRKPEEVSGPNQRMRLGKGTTKTREGTIQRPVTSTGDIKAPRTGEPSSFAYFSKQAAEAQQALAAAEAEKQSTQNELEANSDGTKTYRQHQAQKRVNNPNLNARLTTADQAAQTANMTFADIQARAAQAKEILAAQSQQQKPEVQQQQRTEPVDTKPQQPITVPSQPQQTQTPPPEQQQQQPAPEQKPEPKKKKPKPENTETADQAGQ